MEPNNKKEKHVLYSYLLILVFIGACIALVGYQHHKNFEKHFRTNVENQLQIIADLKMNELKHWLEERRGDANTLLGNQAFTEVVKRYFKNTNDHALKSEIQGWMKEFLYGYNYDAVILTDPQLVKKIVISETTERPQAYVSPQNLDSIRAGKLVFEDFYYDEVKQKVFLKVLIPILDVRQLIGILELRIDPKTYLYPALKNWPMPAKTSETFILRREGNHAVYLSELKFQKNAILNLRIPLENTNVPGVKAILGYIGFVEGIDYRGKPVIAYVGKIPNSPWFLVAKSDKSEVYAPLRDDLMQTVIFGFVMFLLAGFGLWFLWRNQRTLLYKEKIKSAETLQKLNLAINSSQEIVFLTDIEGTITYINPEFTKVYGYAAEEVVGLVTPRILNSGLHKKEDSKLLWDALLDKQTIPKTEYFNKCKDGRLIQIEGSATPVINTDDDIIGFLGLQRDITERKRSEQEQNVMYEITRGIATTDNLHELLRLIHQSLGKLLYADNYFVALYDQNTRLFSFPYYVDQFDSTPEPDEMTKSCTAYVFRTGKPILITPTVFQQLKEQNEVELVGSPSPSWIGVPLQTPNRTIGVLVLQHYEKENVYSERDVQFLDSVGSQIASLIDRKKSEEALRNERLLLRMVIDNIPDSIYCKDTAYRKTLANYTELIYSGANSEADILGKTDFDLYPKEIAEGFFADDQQVLQEGKPVLNREEYLFDSKGQKHWLLTSKLPMKDEDGNITGLVGIGRDITTRRQAEENLRESEIKLNVILQSTADGILAVDGTGKVIKTNNRFAELWRIPQPLIDSGNDNALIGFVLDQLTNPDEFISKVKKLYHSMDEDLDHLYFKDGRTFERYSAPMVMNDSSIGRVWSFRDITERELAEEALQKSEEAYRALFYESKDAMMTLTSDGGFLSGNPETIRMFGCSDEMDFTSRTPAELSPEYQPDGALSSDKADEMMMLAINSGGNFFEWTHKRIDGTEFPATVLLSRIEKDGKVFLQATVRNITELKQAEEALRASQQLIEGIINAMPVRVFWKDRNSVYLGCNSIFASDAGFSDHKDIIGKDDFQMGWRDQAELYRSGDRQVMESGIPILHNEEPQTTPEGNTKVLLTNKMLLKNSKGEIYGILGTSMDITDRIAAEQEIKLKNEELLQANSEKDKFFSIIAHDLRSPFNGFLGLTQIMAEELPSLTMAEIQDLAISMKNSATNLYRLLENLLQWSQLQKGAIPSNPEVFQLLSIASESISMIMEPARSKGIEITYNIADDLKVFADSNMLQTVIRNLVSNAVKFTHKGGKVSISAKAANDSNVEICVQDSGIGMSQTMADNLFRPDVQTSRKGTDGEPSTGLGLLLCKEFIEKNGGRIWVESEEGKGSAFYFTLPIN